VTPRRDRVVIAIVLVAALATVGGLGIVWWWISHTGPGSGPGNPAVQLVPVQTGLAWPIALGFASDGRVFYAERNTGSIRIIENVANLAALRSSTFLLLALPLRLEGVSGSPIRLVALTEASSRRKGP